MEGAGMLFGCGSLFLALLGAGTVGLGLQGFGPRGVPLGFGRMIRGAAGKALGALLVVLGLAMLAPAAWFYGSLYWHYVVSDNPLTRLCQWRFPLDSRLPRLCSLPAF
jgi:hypothetical protein